MNANLYITGIRIFGVAALLSVTFQTYAQEDKKDKNLNREMTLEREYDPSVQDASKVNSLPTIKEPQIKKTPIDYANFTLPVEPGKEIGILSSGKIMTDMSYNKRRGYFNFAGGTYLNLNGDLGYHILSTDKDQLNFSFGHRSTNGKIKLLIPDDYSTGTEDIKNKAKLNDNLGIIDYKHEFDNLSFKLGAQYGYSAFNYYGYYLGLGQDNTLNKNQVNQQIFFDLGFASKEKTSFNYLIDLAFRNFSHKYGMSPDKDGVKENAFGGKLGLNTELDSDKKVGIDALIDYFSYSVPKEDELSFEGFNNHAEITLTPYFAMLGENWNLKLGVNAMFITGDNNKVFVSPHVTADVEVADATVLYGNFLGSIHANSMYDISLENRYADPTKGIMPSRTWLDGTIGIKSGVVPGFWFDIFAGYKITDNEHFFIPYYGSGWGNVGDVKYLDSKVLRLGASFKYSYQQLIDITLKGVYNSWDVSDTNKDNLTQGKDGNDYKAYNKPKLEMEAGLTIKPIDKLAIALNYYLGSGRYTTFDINKVENIKMDNINELNLTGSYTFNDTFGAYLKFNNVLCQKYDLFPGYTAQGFNAMVGVNINF
ncbi:TonB-dependent receptor [Parabacteroides pacaensis]|uniref:TonB-dependent receptor n=1 Tax=Parabacteroides pacaensis TaxID=2086575 RepID=UPI000D0F7DB3|nr:TonB-dependent receptor [Parabacteroides pacaensis]